jgi:hypothetical protein
MAIYLVFLWPFWCILAILVYFGHFGMLYQEKSGNHHVNDIRANYAMRDAARI